jgi:hypothetical protein
MVEAPTGETSPPFIFTEPALKVTSVKSVARLTPARLPDTLS